MSTQTSTAPAHTEDHAKGPGLARGPALVMGAILAAAGLIIFLRTGSTPTNGFPDHTVVGRKLIGFRVNGWTAWFTTAAGALLLFGAAQHLLAKTMSLAVGLALGACSVIALVDGHDVLGLAAGNGLTALAWGVAALVLLANVLLPRLGKDKGAEADHGQTAPVAATDRRSTGRRVAPGRTAEPVVAAPAPDADAASNAASTRARR